MNQYILPFCLYIALDVQRVFEIEITRCFLYEHVYKQYFELNN